MEQQKALIYCRVSSKRQEKEGHGLDSQEHRCKEFATQNGNEVEKVFQDSFTGGGDFMDRPAMKEMLDYIDKNPYKKFIVIFDDLKRFARDTEFHFKLRKAFQVRDVSLKCLNHNFDDSPEGKFVETIFAAQGELEKNQNRRQVIQKQMARLEKGYWAFNPPPGYFHKRDPLHGKLLTRDEPKASILQEALEGFAFGRFNEQIDVQKFLQSMDINNGKTVHLEYVRRLLNRSIYTGYIEYKPWEVTLRKGFHEPIISLDIYNKIQDRLNRRVRVKTRKDISKDFPLRGFVICSECKRKMTASWSKGRNEKHPYYTCHTRGCSLRYKSIRKKQIEDDFEIVLKEITPNDKVLNLAEAITKKVWDIKMADVSKTQKVRDCNIREIDKKVDNFVNKIEKTENDTLVKVYENKIDIWEKEKKSILGKLSSFKKHPVSFGTALERVLNFIKNPYSIWSKDSLNDKRLVLKLIFAEDLSYDQKNGFGTAYLSPIIRTFEGIGVSNSLSVEMAGIEPTCNN